MPPDGDGTHAAFSEYLCAAEVVREIPGYGIDAELRLIERAIETARAQDDKVRLPDALRAKALFFARQNDVSSFVDVWDQLAAAEREIGGKDVIAMMLLPFEVNQFACAAYEAGNLDEAIRLVSRIEQFLKGRYDGVNDPVWLPDLYVASDRIEHAEEIHLSRVAYARSEFSSFRLAESLEHYARFLANRGRIEEARRVRQEAKETRQAIRIHAAKEARELCVVDAVRVSACGIPQDVGIRIYDGEAFSFASDVVGGTVSVYLCAAEAIRDAPGYGRKAELELIERATAFAMNAGDDDALVESLQAKARFHALNDDGASFIEVWDELTGRTPILGGEDAVLMLSSEIERLACSAYKAGNLELGIRLASRIEEWLGGQSEEASEPFWLPDLYAAAGRVDHAESIHRHRIESAKSTASRLDRARSLEHYARFLTGVGRIEEGMIAAEKAEGARREALRLQTTEGYWDSTVETSPLKDQSGD
jgi:tetratricopeptide (TPR) repeat protein